MAIQIQTHGLIQVCFSSISTPSVITVSYTRAEPYFHQPNKDTHPAIIGCLLLVLVLSLFCGVSRTKCTFVLIMLRFIIRQLVGDSDGDYFPHDILLDNIPKDPRTVYTHFDLHPRVHTYVCCPKCFALYDHNSSTPQQCTNKPIPESTCGVDLMISRRIRSKVFSRPIRLYTAQSLKEWLGRMLSRPETERHFEIPRQYTDRSGELRDFWDGSAIHSFMGPDKLLFAEGPAGELRLVFAISMDGFSPFGKTNASVSVSAIYLACLNLPVDIRYRIENIFLAGILPGPHKPSIDAINHALTLIVHQVLPFWEPGVYFSRTALYQSGRLARLAIIPLVADIMAARQMSGFSSISSKYFCHMCYLLACDIENFDISSWPPRDNDTHNEQAKKWQMAETSEDRQKIFDTYALRWSALLDLPYWRALTFTTIDSMHAHWINALKNHLDTVWGIDPSAACSDGYVLPMGRPRRPHKDAMTEGLHKLKKALKERKVDVIISLEKPVIFYLCFDHDIRRAGTKLMMARNLMDWVSSANFPMGTIMD